MAAFAIEKDLLTYAAFKMNQAEKWNLHDC